MPKFDFKVPNIMDARAFAKMTADIAKVSSFSISESTLNRLRGLSGIADQQSKLFDSFKSMVDTHSRWKGQIDRINSDFFKTHAATQARFASVGADLAKTLDLGIGDSLAKAAQQFAAQQTSWLKALGPTLAQLRRSFYPSNLRAIQDLAFEDVEKVVMADGIALYGVPRTSIAEALIGAESAAKRREIIGRRWNAISMDCRKAVEELRSDALVPDAAFAHSRP